MNTPQVGETILLQSFTGGAVITYHLNSFYSNPHLKAHGCCLVVYHAVSMDATLRMLCVLLPREAAFVPAIEIEPSLFLLLEIHRRDL